MYVETTTLNGPVVRMSWLEFTRLTGRDPREIHAVKLDTYEGDTFHRKAPELRSIANDFKMAAHRCWREDLHRVQFPSIPMLYFHHNRMKKPFRLSAHKLATISAGAEHVIRFVEATYDDRWGLLDLPKGYERK